MDKKVERFINLINKLKAGQKDSTFGEQIFVVDIPEKKLINAKKAMNVPEDQTVLIMFDETAFGSTKESVLFTDWGIYYKVYSSFDKKINEANAKQETVKPKTIDPVAEKANKKNYDIFIQDLDKGHKYFKKDNNNKAVIWLSKAINEYKQEMNKPDQLALVHLMFAISRFFVFHEGIDKYITDNDEIIDRKAFLFLIDDIKKAIEYNPKEGLLHYQLALLFETLLMDKKNASDGIRQGYFDNSLKYYDKAIELEQNEVKYKKSRQDLIDENMDHYKRYLADNKTSPKNKNADPVSNANDDKEKTKDAPQDQKMIEVKNKEENKQQADVAEKMPCEQNTQSENNPVEIHPIQINKKIILVCDKTGGNIDVAMSLFSLIKLSCTDEPELRTYAEYKTISF
jgi:tetratricopeptide (TPR) repeat protein